MKRVLITILCFCLIIGMTSCNFAKKEAEKKEIEITAENFLDYFTVYLEEERGSYYKMVTFITLDVSYRIEPKVRLDIVSPIAVGLHIHADNTNPDSAGDETVYLDLSATGAGSGSVDFLSAVYSFGEVSFDIVSARGVIVER